jgi:hypothetical protein
LKNKTQSDCQKIKSCRSKNACPQSDPGANDCGEETDCRND